MNQPTPVLISEPSRESEAQTHNSAVTAVPVQDKSSNAHVPTADMSVVKPAAAKPAAASASKVDPKSPVQTDSSRRVELEKTMEAMNLSADVKASMQAKLASDPAKAASLLTAKKMHVNDFETLTIIGRGAFGEVRVCRKKSDKQVYAMKVMKKTEMLKKNQVAHIRAERDVLALADNPWVSRTNCAGRIIR